MKRRTCEKLLRERKLRPVPAGAVVDKALRGLADTARDGQCQGQVEAVSPA